MGKRKTHEDFVKEAGYKNKHVKILGIYNGYRNEIDVECTYCSKTFKMTPCNILRGHGHRECMTNISHTIQKKTHEQFILELHAVNKNVRVLQKYIDNHTKLKTECLICGNIWYITPNKLLLGRGCPNCRSIQMSIDQTRSHEEFLKIAKEKCEKIKILGRYEKSWIPIECECETCNFKWSARPSTLLYGIGCPQCKASKGEKRIRDFLDKCSVEYECQKKFNNLHGVGGGLLSYDFYLPRYNLLIEYQGQFHDGNIKNNFQSTSDLQKAKEHDRRKKKYANDNSIKLLEIWYWDFDNIEQILLNIIKEDKNT